jgi:hypothetical protein
MYKPDNKTDIKSFPIDIVNIILEYTGYHTFRNGKFIKKLDKSDKRFLLLETIPIIKKLSTNIYIVSIYKYDHTKLYHSLKKIETRIYSGFIHWYMDTEIYFIENYKKIIINRKSIHYIFGHNMQKHNSFNINKIRVENCPIFDGYKKRGLPFMVLRKHNPTY